MLEVPGNGRPHGTFNVLFSRAELRRHLGKTLPSDCRPLLEMCMALNGLLCADVPLRNYSLTQT